MTKNIRIILFVATLSLTTILRSAPLFIDTTVVSIAPGQNSLNAPPDSILSVTFGIDIDDATLTDSTIRVRGSISGTHHNIFNYDGGTKKLTIAPTSPFRAGERVIVTLSRGIKNTDGDSIPRNYSWNFTIRTIPSQGFFLPVQSFPMGTNSSPHSVAAIDVDGNGVLDVAVANYGLGTVTILKNDGLTNFTAQSTFNVGSHPNTVIAADVNNDTIPDLIVTNNGSGTISILKNDGAGNFSVSPVSVGNAPVSVTAADLNGDGSIDLAVANNYDNSITILKNNGNGIFTSASTVAVGSYPTCVIAGDLNNDGFIDLAVTNGQSNSVSILTNNGSGTFALSATVNVGYGPWNVITVDVDGDGYLDLAVSNNNGGTVSVVKNDGAGNFTFSSTITMGGNPSSIIATDINGNGAMDLAVGNIANNTISLLMNNGSGTFTKGTVFNVDSYPCSTVAADFANNGRIFLITANGIGNSLSIISPRMPKATIFITPRSISFSPIPFDSTTSRYLKIYNYGTDSSLTISSITISNNVFSVDKSSLIIAPSDSDSVKVTFTPLQQEFLLKDSLVLVTNDIKNSQVVVPIKAFTEGLALYYPFSGNAVDSTGHGYNGTIMGATLTDDRFGNPNSAYNFNGINTAIECGPILNEILCAPIAKFSIVGWAKTRVYGNASTGNGGFIIGKNAGGGGPYQWNITHADGNLFGYVFSDTLAYNYVALKSPLSVNQWFQFAMVFDGSLPESQRFKFYANNQSNTVSTYQHVGVLGTSLMPTNQQLVIGATHDANNPQSLSHLYDGVIDDIRIYSKPLSQHEIDSLYHLGGWTSFGFNKGATIVPSTTTLLFNSAGNDNGVSKYLKVYNYGVDSTLVINSIAISDTAFVLDKSSLIIPPLDSDSVKITITNSKNRTSIKDSLILLSNDIKKPRLKVLLLFDASGLVAFYPFNGNAFDSTGDGFDPLLVNATPTANRFGTQSAAYNFNGSNNTIQYGDILDEIFCAPVAKFSVAAWAKVNVVSGSIPIVLKSAGGSGPYQWAIGIDMAGSTGESTGQIYFDTLAHNYINMRRTIKSNQWYYYVLVFDGNMPDSSKVRFYVNGRTDSVYLYKKIGTTSTTTQNSQQIISVGSTTLNPGSLSSVESPFSGAIDDIRIYNKPLSPVEIDSLYHLGGWDVTESSNRKDDIPTTYDLYQNYPNPFNPSTTISYSLPFESHVTVRIYNVLGQVIADLVNDLKSPGRYSVIWNAKVSSGIYYYRIEANSSRNHFNDLKKMVLIK